MHRLSNDVIAHVDAKQNDGQTNLLTCRTIILNSHRIFILSQKLIKFLVKQVKYCYIHFLCSTTSYLIIYAKKRKLKVFHLNGISANFCCFIIGDLSPLLPEPVTL